MIHKYATLFLVFFHCLFYKEIPQVRIYLGKLMLDELERLKVPVAHKINFSADNAAIPAFTRSKESYEACLYKVTVTRKKLAGVAWTVGTFVEILCILTNILHKQKAGKKCADNLAREKRKLPVDCKPSSSSKNFASSTNRAKKLVMDAVTMFLVKKFCLCFIKFSQQGSLFIFIAYNTNSWLKITYKFVKPIVIKQSCLLNVRSHCAENQTLWSATMGITKMFSKGIGIKKRFLQRSQVVMDVMLHSCIRWGFQAKGSRVIRHVLSDSVCSSIYNLWYYGSCLSNSTINSSKEVKGHPIHRLTLDSNPRPQGGAKALAELQHRSAGRRDERKPA
ncbi:hypothetical protein PR048_001478 [Dryococelus australis]|uniref:Uncharacterized protein n=1 Tax=Dryococelus australis TaxID=614101 RepID=A0ABQ9IHH0_9NEOP|nr:hypothetical protein PR048_001478 [Dryococelus australis]